MGIDTLGYINDVIIDQGGTGYSYPPIITVKTPVGTASSQIPVLFATVDDAAGSVNTVSVAQAGMSFDTIPEVTVNLPDLKAETLTDVEYFGDYGTIVGVATTSTAAAPAGLKFQLEIPEFYLKR